MMTKCPPMTMTARLCQEGGQQRAAGGAHGVRKGQQRSGSGGAGTLTALDGSNREGSMRAPSAYRARSSPYVREGKATLVRVMSLM